jgi:hypothetical protein
VALPVEPAIYDLLVTMPDGVKRVQVKTTTRYSKDGWIVVVGRRPYSAGNRERLIPYDPELIDWFFIVDGDLAIYLERYSKPHVVEKKSARAASNVSW